MAPGCGCARLHSLSKCCHHPILPGRGKGDPWLLSAAAVIIPEEIKAPHHLPAHPPLSVHLGELSLCTLESLPAIFFPGHA